MFAGCCFDVQIYALKILEKSEIESSTSNIESMKSERNILTLMNHPFIVSLHGAFQTPTRLYLLMDYVCGGELFHHINKQGIFMEEQARVYIGEIVLALEHLHSHGIIHRDLKPENILLAADGHVILTDFGLSKMAIKDAVTHKTVCGTNEYMAPEMITGGGYGKSVDWWALGTLVYEMLTGDPPFHCKNTKKLYNLIRTKKVSLPGYLTKDCHSLIRGLLDRNVERRLGCAPHTAFKVGGVRQLKDHPFFKDLDWVALAQKKIEPPFKLEFENELDVQYFDEQFTKERLTLHAADALHPTTTGTDEEPVTPGIFGGFSWVSPEMEKRVEQHREARSKAAALGELDEEPVKPELTEKQKAKLEAKAKRRAAWEAREKAKAEAAALAAEQPADGETAREQTVVEETNTTLVDKPNKTVTSPSPSSSVGDNSSTSTMERKAQPQNAWNQATRGAVSAPPAPEQARKYRPPRPKVGAAAPAPAPVSIRPAGAWGRQYAQLKTSSRQQKQERGTASPSVPGSVKQSHPNGSWANAARVGRTAGPRRQLRTGAASSLSSEKPATQPRSAAATSPSKLSASSRAWAPAWLRPKQAGEIPLRQARPVQPSIAAPVTDPRQKRLQRRAGPKPIPVKVSANRGVWAAIAAGR